ncbi:hypothetical protein E8D34_05660 [Nocardioides sp. GY 10113]|uniref:hypothetical protein n=1 Tax=Nocardioides sp. GY 10113 TaxID=2569761 RepID=UPI0010A75B0A|nr:hypothetical protein [Nocardioides sp. GY 10113]TIC88408.1 hypothetical protein E8D34_05660 [Nocardioides sp. GY 10113]
MSLMALGGFLVVVGACDLLRFDRDAVSPRRLAAILAAGAVLLALFLAWAGDSFGRGLVLFLGLFAGFALWVVASSAALTQGGAHVRRWRAAAFSGLALGAAVGLLGVGALEEWVEWPARMDSTVFAHWPAADVTVSAGAVLLQLATGNLIVRLVLDAVGVPAVTNEKKLKGGRLLGPMERIFIVGLGHIGEVTAAAIVVAAKGLLRFPELNASAKAGPSDVTEYFLIGSFASWLIGLAGVSLIYLA